MIRAVSPLPLGEGQGVRAAQRLNRRIRNVFEPFALTLTSPKGRGD